jgi:hypothetical protein
MKISNHAIVVLIITLLSLQPSIIASEIELTDIDGRKIKAEITSHKGDSVSIKTAAGKHHTLAADRLTKETMAAVNEELTKQEIAASKWRYSKGTDDLTGKIWKSTFVTSENEVRTVGRHYGQYAWLNIRNHPTYGEDAYVTLGEGGMVMVNSDINVVFDDSPPASYSVLRASDKSVETLFISDYAGFKEAFLKAKRVKISVSLYNNGAFVFEFPTAGFSQEKHASEK